jgi:hypothetical protein
VRTIDRLAIRRIEDSANDRDRIAKRFQNRITALDTILRSAAARRVHPLSANSAHQSDFTYFPFARRARERE